MSETSLNHAAVENAFVDLISPKVYLFPAAETVKIAVGLADIPVFALGELCRAAKGHIAWHSEQCVLQKIAGETRFIRDNAIVVHGSERQVVPPDRFFSGKARFPEITVDICQIFFGVAQIVGIGAGGRGFGAVGGIGGALCADQKIGDFVHFLYLFVKLSYWGLWYIITETAQKCKFW